MKITMYTITECQFSKQEKEYLSSHGLQFEEKNLDTNREFLTEMLAVGSNFAGTPVTKIEKDDGQIAVLKGFTAAEFDKALGLTAVVPVEPTSAEASAGKSVKPAEQPAPVAAAPVATPEAPMPVPTPEVVAPAAVEPAPAPVAPFATTSDPAMASVLNTLEQQAQVAAPVAPAPQAPVAPPAPLPGAPVIPEPQF